MQDIHQRLEQMRAMFKRDAGPIIDHTQSYSIGLRARIDSNPDAGAQAAAMAQSITT